MRYELRFGLLGTPVLFDPVDYDDAVHPVSSPKVRTLLAALLLEPGRVVSVDALKDALWGGSPPASAHASLHNHVTRLRRLLDDPERLRAVPPGYVLRVDEGELDVHVFETHVATARSAHAAGTGPAPSAPARPPSPSGAAPRSAASPPNSAATPSPNASPRRDSSSSSGATTRSWPSAATDSARLYRSWPRSSPTTPSASPTTAN